MALLETESIFRFCNVCREGTMLARFFFHILFHAGQNSVTLTIERLLLQTVK